MPEKRRCPGCRLHHIWGHDLRSQWNAGYGAETGPSRGDF
jgi:hypothetical protein